MYENCTDNYEISDSQLRNYMEEYEQNKEQGNQKRKTTLKGINYY